MLGALATRFRRHRLDFRLARARRRPTVAAVKRLAARLIVLRRFSEAEELVRLGLARSPDHPDLLEQLAFCAHNAGRYRKALTRWRHLRTLAPNMPMAWCGITSNARELRLLDEAGTVATEALARFPGDAVVISEVAKVRESCRAFAEAADLWRSILDHPAADADWHMALARNLLSLQRYDEVERVLRSLPEPIGSGSAARRAARAWGEIAMEASELRRAELDAFLAEALRRFGEEAYAVRQVAETTDDLTAAGDALRRILETTATDAEAREAYVRVLVRCDRLEDAEREIEVGLRLAPDHASLRALRGLIAMRRQDWVAAQAAWDAYSKSRPDDLSTTFTATRLRHVRELEEAETAAGSARPTPIAPGYCDEPETRELLLRFESIGADCEFGTVQRRYGAEPLGLLRWTDTDVRSLLAALAARFQGVGDPEHTELVVGSVGEIDIRDRRWNLAMHTFLYETEVSLATLYPKMCRRTAYLRDKLLEDLRVGEKILVFKSDRVDRRELLALHDALSELGPARLLNVRIAAGSADFPAGDPGSVEEVRPGLLVGYLSRVAVLADLAFDEWVEVCRDADRRRPAAGRTTSPVGRDQAAFRVTPSAASDSRI